MWRALRSKQPRQSCVHYYSPPSRQMSHTHQEGCSLCQANWEKDAAQIQSCFFPTETWELLTKRSKYKLLLHHQDSFQEDFHFEKIPIFQVHAVSMASLSHRSCRSIKRPIDFLTFWRCESVLDAVLQMTKCEWQKPFAMMSKATIKVQRLSLWKKVTDVC